MAKTPTERLHKIASDHIDAGRALMAASLAGDDCDPSDVADMHVAACWRCGSVAYVPGADHVLVPDVKCHTPGCANDAMNVWCPHWCYSET